MRRTLSTLAVGGLGLCGLWQCGSDDDAASGSVGDPRSTGTAAGGSTGAPSLQIPALDGSENEPQLPPEEEVEPTFRAPVATGRLVWTANPASDRVALVDAVDLTVTAVEVGQVPTYIAAIPASEAGADANRAIVVNVASSDASLLTVSGSTVHEQRIPLQPGANSWAVSASGRWAVAWTNAAEVEGAVDPTEGFQDVTVIAVPAAPAAGVAPEVPRAYRLSVGYRPARLFVSADERRLFVVTAVGITEIALDRAAPEVVQDLPLDPGGAAVAPVSDVSITPDGDHALVRREGSRVLEIWELATGEHRELELSGAITDLDLIADGSRAIAVVRSVAVESGAGAGGAGAGGAGAGEAGQGGETSSPVGGAAGETSALGTAGSAGAIGASGADGSGGGVGGVGQAGASGAEPTAGDAGGAAPGVAGAAGAGGTPAPDLPAAPNTSEVFILPVPGIFSEPGRFDRVAIGGTLVGSVSASLEGERALLYTNATPSDRLTVLDTRPGEGYLTSFAVSLVNPIRSVYPTPDALHAVALLDPVPGVSVHAGAFAVVPIDGVAGPLIRNTDAPPVAVALAPSPSTRGIVTVRDEATGVYGAYLIRLPELQVDRFPLLSPPTATGLVPVARRAFIAQEHPGGRITFIDLDGTGSMDELARTLTGYELTTRVIGDASGGR